MNSKVTLETQIYQAEGAYIAETAGTGGNIIQGFDNYLKSNASNRKRVDVLEYDRVFSQSSVTYKKVSSVCRGFGFANSRRNRAWICKMMILEWKMEG